MSEYGYQTKNFYESNKLNLRICGYGWAKTFQYKTKNLDCEAFKALVWLLLLNKSNSCHSNDGCYHSNTTSPQQYSD